MLREREVKASVYVVIMAGGGGTRLWPLSRRDRPKPFLPLLDGGSLLQATVARLSPMVEPRDVYLVTDARYATIIEEQLPDVPRDNVIGEPVGRNTAAAVALAAAAIDRPGDDVMVVLPADHQIADEAGFRTALAQAAAAASDGALVTLGITPTGPETGYGYVVATASPTSGGPAAGIERAARRAIRGEATSRTRRGADRHRPRVLECRHLRLAPGRRARVACSASPRTSSRPSATRSPRAPISRRATGTFAARRSIAR